MAQSIIQRYTDKNRRECFLCRVKDPSADLSPKNLEKHHFMHGTANKRLAEQFGLWGYLCPEHHRNAPDAVHNDHETDLFLMQIAQSRFEKYYGHEKWMEIFGKNYLIT